MVTWILISSTLGKGICAYDAVHKMREGLERTLVEQFPEYFEYYDNEWGDGEELQPPIRVYGFQCGDGWYSLIYRLCKRAKEAGVELKAHQVKQKFGGLRFYHGGIQNDDAEIQEKFFEIRNEIKDESFWTCIECGQNAHMPSNSMRAKCLECSPDRRRNE